jgi:FMN reductase
MPYFLALTGSTTKFSKTGFLLRSIGSILEQRSIEFRAIHASDLPPGEPATQRIANQFVADASDQIEPALAILLVTPATKESSPTLLASLLDLLPDNAFGTKPVPARSRSWKGRLEKRSFDWGRKQSRLVSISERAAG